MSTTTIYASDLLKDFPDKYKMSDTDQLFIDIDNEEQYANFKKRLPFFQNFFESKITIKISKSGLPHRHIYMRLPQAYTVSERIIMQSYLCSDPTRDLLSLVQHLDGEENPIIFNIEGEIEQQDRPTKMPF